MRFPRLTILIAVLSIALSGALSGVAFAEALGVRVLVLPFDVHSSTDVSALRRRVMEAVASSLDGAGAEVAGIEEIKRLVLKEGVRSFGEERALEVSSGVKADFAVLGSLTALGGTMSVDMRVFDLKDRATIAFFSSSSRSEADLVERLKAAGPKMGEKMAATIKGRPVVRTGTVDKVLVSGNRRVDSTAISKKLTSRAGEPFSPDNVREDIRAIYSMGYFDDVSADMSEGAGGKILTYTVKEMPFIKKIEFKGNSEVKEDKIREELTLRENTVLDRTLLAENAERIRALYEEEGYYTASIIPEVRSDGVEAAVVFNIAEGPAVKVKRITVIGNSAFSGGEIKDVMNTSEAGPFSFITQSGRFNELIFSNDLSLIAGHYFDNGYIKADILDSRVLLSDDKKWFYITIALSEGDRYRVGSVDVEGDILTTKKDLMEKARIRKGDVFSRSKLSRDIEAVADVYGEKGYAFADVKPVTRINEEDKTIDITLSIAKNELTYIERIDITGNTRTRDKVIRREVEVEEGGIFSSTALKRSRNNLRRIGYFEDVRITQTRGSTEDRVKINVDVLERPTGSISLGMGYSSVDKLIATASIAQSNFMGTGVKLDLSGTVSASSSRYVLGFTEPWLFDKPISAGFDIYNTEKDYPDFKIRKNGFDLRGGFPVKDRYTRGFLTYKYERAEIFDVAATASSEIKEQEGMSKDSSVKGTLRRDTRDDAFFPSEGSVLIFSTEFAGGPLGGTNYFIKYEGEAVHYFPLLWDTTFSLHGSLGYVQGYSGRTVPLYEKYFLGGINSVRGFETRSISPKDPATGNFLGGNTMMVFNAEFVFPLYAKQNIKGVVFLDAGNSYKGHIDLGDIRTGAGFGVRWFSPMGPLRLELGFNLNRREGESSQEWDFTIGTAF